jgi:hypothetical protein
MGKAASGTGNTLAGTGGSIDHTHSVPAHYHSMGAGATYLAGSGVPKFVGAGLGSYTLGSAGNNYRDMQSGDGTGNIGLVTGGVNGNAAMTSGSQNSPYLVVNYIIKAT